MNLLKPKYEIGGQKYVVTKQIGEGAYAFVYRVKPSGFRDRPQCALKKMICQTDEQLEEARREMKLLSEIYHPNVLHLLSSQIKENKNGQTEALLLMPLYERTLQDLIDCGPGYPRSAFQMDPRRCLRICVDFCNGLQAIHAFGFRHGDFKPANILLRTSPSGAEEVVVTDLGSACPLTVVVSSRAEALAVQEIAAAICTASYRAPELLDTPSHCTITAKTDVWSIGCTLFNLLFSRTPFENPIEGFSTLAACSAKYTCPNDAPFSSSGSIGRGMGLSMIAVAQACLLTSPSARPELQQVLGMLECCLSMPADSPVADPGCLVFALLEHRQASFEPSASHILMSNTVVANSDKSAASARGRCTTADSMDEFGDFEGADALSSSQTDINGVPPAITVVEDDQTIDPENDWSSFVSNPTVDVAPVRIPDGTVIFEGSIHVMRQKGGINHKMINKTVWGVLTDKGIIIRKTVDPASKVHTAMRFNTNENELDTSICSVPATVTKANISVMTGRAKETGLGPNVLIIRLHRPAQQYTSTSSDVSIGVQRASSDIISGRNAGSLGSPSTKRRKSIFTFGSPASPNDKDGKQPSRRRSTALLSPFSNGQLQSSYVDMLEFGVDSADELKHWLEAIISVAGAERLSHFEEPLN